MPRFQVDVMVCFTAYVEAASKEAATALITQNFDKGEWVELGTRDIPMTEGIVVSPCMTSYGFDADAIYEEAE